MYWVSPRMVTLFLARPCIRAIFSHGESFGIRVSGRGVSVDLMFGVGVWVGPSKLQFGIPKRLKSAPFGSVSVLRHVFMLEHEHTRQAMALAMPTRTSGETEAG